MCFIKYIWQKYIRNRHKTNQNIADQIKLECGAKKTKMKFPGFYFNLLELFVRAK